MIDTTTSPTTAPRFSRNDRQKARRGPGGAAVGASAIASTAMANPRIDQAVEKIDHQIDDNDDARDQHDAALEGGIVAPPDRFDQPLPDAGPGEDRFGK